MEGTTTAHNTGTSTTTLPSSSTPLTSNSDDSIKLAIAIALLRSKLSSQSKPQQQQQQQQHSLSALRWKLKAKDRKKEVLRLQQELKHLEADLRGDLYPKNASCKCYFFTDLKGLSPRMLNFGAHHRLTDILRRRFLRQVRLHKSVKNSTRSSIDQRNYAELYREEETEQLKLSAEFLVDLCQTSNSSTPHYASLTHQAVDFILGSLNHGLSAGRDQDAPVIEGIISSLIVRLVKRMSTPTEEELYNDPEADAQSHVQHTICQLGSVAYIGQRVLLAVCHRISEQAEILRYLDPFDESFALIHDSLFVMIHLIEILVSDYLVSWSKDEGFDISMSCCLSLQNLIFLFQFHHTSS
ncbi:hypothetical protein KSS87_011551 [Heliosperma pusillum]|nr:hypothetical protein KSS87_011551 [Heliosperma pusillum]